MVKKKKLTKKCYFIIGVSILLFLLIWGLIGSSQAEKIENTCDIGINDGHELCWTWHQNVLGDIGDAIDEIIDGQGV